MKKVLLIRRTKEYFYYNKLGWKYHGFCEQMVYSWKFIFKMDYLHFRKELVKISQLSIVKNNFDFIILYEDKNLVKSLPSDTLLVPFDEDDWMSPFLLSEIENNFEGKNLYWDVCGSYVNGNKEIGCKENRYLPDICRYALHSCGYCILLSSNLFNEIFCHWEFNEKGATYIKKTLSLKLDTIASINILREKSYSFSDLIILSYNGTKEDKRIPLDFKVQWQRYNDLCKELLDSCKFSYNHIINNPEYKNKKFR